MIHLSLGTKHLSGYQGNKKFIPPTLMFSILTLNKICNQFIDTCHIKIQGGSDITGTDLCVNKCKQSRSFHISYQLMHHVL